MIYTVINVNSRSRLINCIIYTLLLNNHNNYKRENTHTQRVHTFSNFTKSKYSNQVFPVSLSFYLKQRLHSARASQNIYLLNSPWLSVTTRVRYRIKLSSMDAHKRGKTPFWIGHDARYVRAYYGNMWTRSVFEESLVLNGFYETSIIETDICNKVFQRKIYQLKCYCLFIIFLSIFILLITRFIIKKSFWFNRSNSVHGGAISYYKITSNSNIQRFKIFSIQN